MKGEQNIKVIKAAKVQQEKNGGSKMRCGTKRQISVSGEQRANA